MRIRAALTSLSPMVAAACAAGALRTAPDAQRPLGPVTALVAAHGQAIACAQNGLFALRPTGYRRLARLPLRPFAAAAREPDGALLVGGGVPAERGELAVLSPAGALLLRRTVATDLVYAVAWSPRPRTRLAAGLADGRVLVLDTFRDRGGQALAVRAIRAVHRHTAPCRAVAFTSDGAAVVSAGLDGLLVRTELAGRGQRISQDHTAGVTCLAWTPAGTLASGARDGKVRLHDPHLRLRRTYQRLGAAVTALAFDPKRGGFVAGLRDGVVVGLDPDLARADVVARLEEPVHALLALEGELLVGLFGRVVRLGAGGAKK